MYVQEFTNASIPSDWILNSFGTPNGTVEWSVAGLPSQFGAAILPLDVGTSAHEGRCLTMRPRHIRRKPDRIGFRWFHFQNSQLRYHLGLFKTLSHADTARIAFCFNGDDFGVLTTTPTKNIFAAFSHTPQNQTHYQCELEHITGGTKVTLFDAEGSEIASISRTTDIPDSSEIMNVGACVWAGANITAGTELVLDRAWVDIRS